jgi:ribonucleoside-diphosphate reductase alpha chain
MTKKYTHEQALTECLNYFNGDELASNVFLEKYALMDNEDKLLEKTPEDMHWRMAKEFARIEKNKFKKPLTEKEIFECFDKFKYIVPAGSPMSGIGNKYQKQTLGNCYVVDNVIDSIGGICYTDQVMAQLMKRRAGVGVDISNIRPAGLTVENAARTTDGFGVFADKYSETVRGIAQGGRRGALLLSILVHHPEIEQFITIKRDKKRVTGANISVRFTDEFLKAVEENKEYEVYWPMTGKKQISKMVNARKIWDLMMESNYNDGEPGCMFWDTMINNSLSNRYGVIDSKFYDRTTNPCGEILLGIDSCRLTVVNLMGFVEDAYTDKAFFNYQKFAKYVEIGQRLMDDLIDLELECIEDIINKIKSDKEPQKIKQTELDTWLDIKDSCIKGRRTGFGITALADVFAALGFKYGTKESLFVTDNIFKQFAISSMKSSCEMAKELGAFPIYNAELEYTKMAPILKRIFDASPEVAELHKKYGRRNISLTTCPPTGSVSILTQTSSGVEPVFELSYKRRKKINSTNSNAKVDFIDQMGDKWQEFTLYHHGLEKWIKINNKEAEKSPYFGSTVNDIDLEASIDLQSTIQKWITHSISKTVNAPKNVSMEMVSKLYMRAWKGGCKGLTFYRDGSRTGVLITENSKPSGETIKKTDAPKRPKELPCEIYHIKITKKLDKIRTFEYMVMIGLYNNEPYEVFAVENGKYDKKLTKGKIIKEKSGNYHLIFEDGTEIKNITKNTTEEEDMLTRMTSTTLRHGVPIQYIVDQLLKTEGDMFSFGKSIARALKKHIKDGTKGSSCEKCGEKLIFENGCFICKGCGNTKCQ